MSRFCVFFPSVLLKRGADFNIEDENGARPDDVAMRCGAHDCRDAIEKKRQELLQRLKTIVKRVRCSTLIRQSINQNLCSAPIVAVGDLVLENGEFIELGRNDLKVFY